MIRYDAAVLDKAGRPCRSCPHAGKCYHNNCVHWRTWATGCWGRIYGQYLAWAHSSAGAARRARP